LQRLERIRKAGFTSTMLWWGDDELPNPQEERAVLKKAADLGLTIENIHVPFDDANWLWAAQRDIHYAYMSHYIKYIDFCASYGIPMIVMHVSKGALITKPNKYGIDAMKRLNEYALEAGVMVALENTHAGELVEALLDGIFSNNLGLCYDTSHGRLYGDSDFSLLKGFHQRLKCVHISDNDGTEDRHWNIGEGLIDWDLFVRSFPTDSACRTLSLEVYPRDESQPQEAFLKDAYAKASALRELIAQSV
jgi:sugar phosphate isomerase/epimerase